MSAAKSESLTLTNGSTTFSAWVLSGDGAPTWTIEHPSGPSTTYSVQVANMDEQTIKLTGAAAASWAADDESIAGILKAAAANFAIKGRAGFVWQRLKAVTTAASNTATVRASVGVGGG